MTLLKSLDLIVLLFDGAFQLLDVLGTTFPKGSLCLSISLLAFL